jgi:DNA replication protein DnaC
MREKLKLNASMLVRMNIPQRYWDVRFKFVPNSVKKYITPYLRNIDKNIAKGDGFLFFGNNGRGKTATAVLIAMEARRNFASVYFIQTEELREYVLSKEMFDDNYSVLDRVKEVDLLILDDLGKEHADQNAWSAKLIENVLRVRIANKRSTIITTNMKSKKMSEKYSNSMIQAMKESLYQIAFIGDNLRKEKNSEVLVSSQS